MKANRQELIKALGFAKRFCGKGHDSLGDADRVLIDSIAGMLYATDHDITVKCPVKFDGDIESFSISPNDFIGILKADKDVSVEMYPKKNQGGDLIGISVGEDFKILKTKPASNFPNFSPRPDPDPSDFFKLPKKSLMNFMPMRPNADEHREMVLCVSANAKLGMLVGCQINRVHAIKTHGIKQNVLIPKKTLYKGISGSVEYVSVTVAQEIFVAEFENGASAWCDAFDEGNFPDDLSNVLKKHDKKIVLNKQALESVCAKAIEIASDKPADISISESVVKMRMESCEKGLYEDVIEIKGGNFNGNKLETGIRPQFVLDALNGIESESVAIHVDGEEDMFVFCAPADTKDKYRAAVMPYKEQSLF